MPEESPSSNAPTTFRAWLAGNQKLAILAAVAVVLLIVAGLLVWRPWVKGGPTKLPTANKNTEQNSNTAVTNSSRNTFERFQATVNRAETNTNANRPTKEETAAAIQQLQKSN